ncbi:peptidase [Xanthomonas sp. LMG 8992]|nr:peptidase [Xanthomonas sp. LMG 8992]
MRMLLLSASLFMGGAAQAANDALAGDAGGDADALERHALPASCDPSEACGPAMPG